MFKEINQNFNRKDKRETMRFLIKHGLSAEEAKKYIALGKEFDVQNLDPKLKLHIQENFQAQVFAFRKLRERLLMNDNNADIYNQKKVAIPRPSKDATRLSRDQLEGMLKSLDGQKIKYKPDIKAQILGKTNRTELEAMLKLARRREYY